MGPVVAATGASGQAALQPVDLTVMTFNIWNGATVTRLRRARAPGSGSRSARGSTPKARATT